MAKETNHAAIISQPIGECIKSMLTQFFVAAKKEGSTSLPADLAHLRRCKGNSNVSPPAAQRRKRQRLQTSAYMYLSHKPLISRNSRPRRRRSTGRISTRLWPSSILPLSNLQPPASIHPPLGWPELKPPTASPVPPCSRPSSASHRRPPSTSHRSTPNFSHVLACFIRASSCSRFQDCAPPAVRRRPLFSGALPLFRQTSASASPVFRHHPRLAPPPPVHALMSSTPHRSSSVPNASAEQPLFQRH